SVENLTVAYGMSRLGRRLEPCRSTRASAAERLPRCGGRESSSVQLSVQAASAMGDCGVGEVLGQLAQAGPRLGGFGAFGADADEGGSAQQGDDDIAAESAGEDLVDRAGHLVGSGREFDSGEDLFVSDAVGGPALAGGEHLGEFLRGGLDP